MEVIQESLRETDFLKLNEDEEKVLNKLGPGLMHVAGTTRITCQGTKNEICSFVSQSLMVLSHAIEMA